MPRKKKVSATQKAAEIVSERLAPRGRKVNRTLSLDSDAYDELTEHCKVERVPVSSVIDELIREYLKIKKE